MPTFNDAEPLDAILMALICFRIFARGEAPVLHDMCVPLPLEDVLYIFIAGDSSTNKLSASWPSSYEILPRRVYVRARSGVYALAQRTMEGFAEALGFPFEDAGRSLIVNLRQIKWFNYDEGLLRLGFVTDSGDHIEYLTISLPHSRRIHKALRRFHRGLLARSRGTHARPAPPDRPTPAAPRLRSYRAQNVALDEAVDDDETSEE